MTNKRPEMTTIFYDPKTKCCVGLGDFGDDGLPRYAACWSEKLPLTPEESVKRNTNVNWDLVEEMYGPEENWINGPGKSIKSINWKRVWEEFDSWYKINTQVRSIHWEEQKARIQEMVEKYRVDFKPSDINFSDCIICGKFMEHDHKCENQ